MTRSRKAPQKKSRKKTKKKAPFQSQLKKGLGGVLVLILLVVLAGLLVQHFIKRKAPVRPFQPSVRASVRTQPVRKPPALPPPKPAPATRKAKPAPVVKPAVPVIPHPRPKVAIIIDDIGYDRAMAKKFLSLDTVLTFSVLPYSPFQTSILKAARSRGWETMLHLPMEPDEYPRIDPGPGALLTRMTPDELILQLNRDIDAVPGIKGVNNHMGSKMTTVSTQMYQVFSVLKKRGLYFVDSRTCNHTICKPSARMLQIPFAERDVFIDHLQTPTFIRAQLKELVHTAKKHGHAIGIAHPHPETYKTLREMLPQIQQQVHLVPVSALVPAAG